MSVPYSLYSSQSGSSVSLWNVTGSDIYFNGGNVGIGTATPYSKLEINGSSNSDALFVIKNNVGDTVMAVYNEGVRFFVDDMSKSARGGFAIGNKNTRSNNSIFTVTSDSVRIYFNESAKPVRGGFAIGNKNTQKGVSDIFYVNSDSVRIYFDETAKPVRGGFAIGNKNTQKGVSDYFFVNNDSTRITTSSTGGFGISSRDAKPGNGNGNGINYLNITPDNMFIGQEAGENNQGGFKNIFMGFQSGYNNSLGSTNIFIGEYSGYTNLEGNSNVFVGQNSGFFNDFGDDNVFVGQRSGYNNTNGSANVFIGQNTGEANQTGTQNGFLGYNTGNKNSTGTNNVFLGTQAGYNNQNGNYNIFIGNNAGYNETGSNKLFIENSDANYQNSLIYGDFNSNQLRLNAKTGIGIDDEGYRLNVNGNINFYGLLYQNGEPYNPSLIKAQLTSNLTSPQPFDAPAEGFMFYNDGTMQPKGFYYWTGLRWVKVAIEMSPMVTTSDATSVTLNTAILSGVITDDFGYPVTATGVTWNTTGNPTIENDPEAAGNLASTFTASVSGLTQFTTYYFRAYATSSGGTSYGEEKTFITNTSPTIQVTSPNTTLTFYKDFLYYITWSYTISENVKIHLYKNGVFLRNISSGTACDGSFEWTVPNDLADGTDYEIYIESTTQPAVNDFSDANFTISTPNISVYTPVSLVEWIVGEQYNITWTSNLAENLKIDLYQNNVFVETINASTPNDGTYAYTVTETLDAYNDYKIRISSTTNSAFYRESAAFRILVTFTDADGNTYYGIRIGTQVWSKQNLKTTKYADGTAIPNITDNTAWAALTYGAYCNYDNSEANATTYGRLYNWFAIDMATNFGNSIAPFGWHVPSDAEWNILFINAGGLSVAGTNLKSKFGWYNDINGTDNYGFNILPSGMRGNSGSFGGLLTHGTFWSITPINSTEINTPEFYYSQSNVGIQNCTKNYGLAIRLVKDINTATGITRIIQKDLEKRL